MLWIESTRWSVCVLAAFLAMTGYIVAGVPVSLLALCATFCITAATMVQNDWRDREHDAKKGKRLALERKKVFFVWVAGWWLIAYFLTFLYYERSEFSVLLLGIVAGVVYSETRQVPLAPLVIVSVTSASPILIASGVLAGTAQQYALFLSASLLILSREISKDLDDMLIDRGYKWTIPVRYGAPNARLVSRVLGLCGVGMSYFSFPHTLSWALFALYGVGVLTSRRLTESQLRNHLDVLMLGVMSALCALYYFAR